MRTHGEDLSYVNSHRIALGHPVFTVLTDEQLQCHLLLIEQRAAYGADPWFDTYEVLVVQDEETYPTGLVCDSLQECTTIVAQLERQFQELQERCDAIDSSTDDGHHAVRALQEAAPAALRHYEGCYPHALHSNGRRYWMVDEDSCDEDSWELVL